MSGSSADGSRTGLPGQPVFVTTHWSVVLKAGRSDSTSSGQALEDLCATYWYPLYAFARRMGHPAEDAKDFTQEFFARLLSKDYLAGVAPEKGRFRSFLLTAFKRFLADQWDRAHAAKRGGGQALLSLDAAAAETRYDVEPVEGMTPERLYDRRWAHTLVNRVFEQLRGEFKQAGKAAEFDGLKGFLTAGKDETDYGSAAARMEMTEGALRVAVHRLRRRFRELFRAEIARTVEKPEDVEEEIRYLLSVL